MACSLILITSGCTQTGQVIGRAPNLTYFPDQPGLDDILDQERINMSDECYDSSLKIASVSYYPSEERLYMNVENTGEHDLRISPKLGYVTGQTETRETMNLPINETILIKYRNISTDLFEVIVQSLECANARDNITRIGISIR